MAKQESDLAWVTLGLDDLPEEIRELAVAMKASYRKYAEDKAAFETRWQQLADRDGITGHGEVLKFGYRFGKFSIAIADGERKVAKPAQSGKSWSEMLRR